MARSSHLAAQRRELSFILNRLTAYTTLADRDILEQRLRTILEKPLSDDFYIMANEVFDKIEAQHPSVANEARGNFYGMLSEVKYEYRTPTESTSMLMVGLMMSTFFKTACPNVTLSQETADKVVEILKKHYINPKAKITIFHEMLRSNQGPANDTETAGRLTRAMAECKGTLYTKEHLDVPESEDDPIAALENERIYGLYLRHLVITVTVPAGELAVVHPYRWWDTTRHPEFCVSGHFDPNQILKNPFAFDMQEALKSNIASCQTIFTEPMPLVKGLDFFEQQLSPFRIYPLLTNAVQTADCEPDQFCASIAIFCSRPDAAKIYASEIRIALSMETSRDQPFSGDCISFQDTGVDLNTYATNFERFFNMLGLTDVVIHEEPRYYEYEDEGGRIYVNARGVSMPLNPHFAPVMPAHFLN